jgi:FG-GAP-like repeat
MTSNSAVGDLDNDGHAEVLSTGRNTSPTINPDAAAGPERGKLYVYKTTDANSDGKPDKFWNDEAIDFGWKVNKNPVLYDVNADGYLDIIMVDERQNVWVYDKNKNVLPGWPIQVGNTDWAEGSIAVADLDHDGKGEIALGVKSGVGTKGAIYIWRYDGTPFTVNPFHEFAENERADSAIVFADIDNDLNLDLLTSTKNDTTGKLYAFKLDGNPVGSFWNGTTTFTVPNGQYQEAVMPKLAIGDLDHDGSLEIVFTSRNFLHVLDKNGQNVAFFNSPKPIEDNVADDAPLIADIDGNNTDGNREIIINNNGKIYAYNYSNGNACARYPLVSEDESPFIGSPSIADINNDGKNEIVTATRSAFTYVYKTNGDSDKIDWGSYRGNPSNTGTYKEVCNNELDLMIKDSANDTGAEPNTVTQYMWNSSDIWVRNNSNDTSLEHENPKYRASGNPNYIKVRVINKSCADSAGTGAESVTVFWAKASTGLGWYDPWHGNIFNGYGSLMGHEVGTRQLPPMHKGEEIVLDFPWIVPNPAIYGTDGDQWHFCLLAQINGG